jgi:hypothetical protein
MNRTKDAWIAFLLCSGLIIVTFLPVLNYGFIYDYYPIFLIIGCAEAQSAGECLRIELLPLASPVLTIAALIICKIAIGRAQYLLSVMTAVATCVVSWLFFYSTLFGR